MEKRASIIMVAWPQTPAIQVGTWYDSLMKLSGFNKNDYYMAGHSAIILVEPISGELFYFDFGRYHTPVKHGRVRDAITDPDLIIHENAVFNRNGEISNINTILTGLSLNPACHGKGKMYASINYGIDFEAAYNFAKGLQRNEAIPYGPFEPRGTNCSRFTARVFKAARPGFFKKLRLNMPLSLTPTPLGNVLIAASKDRVFALENLKIEEKVPGFFKFLSHWVVPSIKFKTNNSLSVSTDVEKHHSLILNQ